VVDNIIRHDKILMSAVEGPHSQLIKEDDTSGGKEKTPLRGRARTRRGRYRCHDVRQRSQ
jgi:hypothetical protein